eukprot:6476785-Amphidinium_carterae.1
MACLTHKQAALLRAKQLRIGLSDIEQGVKMDYVAPPRRVDGCSKQRGGNSSEQSNKCLLYKSLQ